MLSRNDIFDFVLKTYGTQPEYLWLKAPNYAVLRQSGNAKWYATIMDVPKNKLGLEGEEKVDVLNVKCDPIMIGSMLKTKGFLPAYHMSKTNWISILLDSSVADDEILSLIDFSYTLTMSKAKQKKKK